MVFFRSGVWFFFIFIGEMVVVCVMFVERGNGSFFNYYYGNYRIIFFIKCV